MVLAVGADHLDVFGGDVGFLVAFAQRAFDGRFAVRSGTAGDTPRATFGAPRGTVLHDHVSHLAARRVAASQQNAGRTVGAPMLAAAGAVHPAIAGLVYVFDRRQNASVLVARCLAFRFQFTTADIPQVSPRDAQFAGQMPGQRQAEADDAVRIALNTVDERTTEAFQRERSGDFQRLASGNVPFDVGIGEFAEMDFGVACAAHGTPGREIDQAVAGPQFAGRAAHALQSFAGHGFAVRLAVAFAAQEEHRITAENQRADRRLGQSRLSGNSGGDGFGDGRHVDAGEVARGGDFRLGIVDGLASGGFAQVFDDGFAFRILDFLGLERVGNHAIAGCGGGSIGHIAIRTVNGLGLGYGKNHHTLLDAQIVDGDTFLTGGRFQRSRLIHVRDANCGADTRRIQHVTARLGLGSKN